MKWTAIGVAALLLASYGAASADTYKSANFSGQIAGGGANVQPPFTSVLTPGEPFGGSLVFDENLVPAAGSGFVNVFFSDFPDIGTIPPATALTFTLGGLPAFTLADAVTPPFGTQEAAIQYNNGNFNGLFYISDFTFDGAPYELSIQGGTLSIVPIVNGNPTFSSLVNGSLNFSLTNEQPFTPPVAVVPGPSTWTELLVGFVLLGTVGQWCARKKATSLSLPQP
jgi:hypothetical protein